MGRHAGLPLHTKPYTLNKTMTYQRLPQVPPMELPEELKETFALLEAQGLNPQFCDTPVPYFDAGIPCGSLSNNHTTSPSTSGKAFGTPLCR